MLLQHRSNLTPNFFCHFFSFVRLTTNGNIDVQHILKQDQKEGGYRTGIKMDLFWTSIVLGLVTTSEWIDWFPLRWKLRTALANLACQPLSLSPWSVCVVFQVDP